jgi:hypothetical protein
VPVPHLDVAEPRIAEVAPGDRGFLLGADMSNSGAVVRFTDAAGTRWLRRPDGYLNEFPTA